MLLKKIFLLFIIIIITSGCVHNKDIIWTPDINDASIKIEKYRINEWINIDMNGEVSVIHPTKNNGNEFTFYLDEEGVNNMFDKVVNSFQFFSLKSDRISSKTSSNMKPAESITVIIEGEKHTITQIGGLYEETYFQIRQEILSVLNSYYDLGSFPSLLPN